MKKLDVMYATNSNYLNITLASILSLIENSNLEKINLHIATENLSIKEHDRIREFLEYFPNVEVAIYPIDNMHLEQYNIPGWHDTQAANARLFFQDILGKKLDNIDQLLYLDADTIVVDDITGLEKYQKGVYAARDASLPGYYQKYGLDRYFNSGVLYIDTKVWKHQKCQDKIKKFVKENSKIKLIYPDQDIFNMAINKDIHNLSIKYNLSPMIYDADKNFTTKYCKRRGMDVEDALASKENPSILHSTGLLGIKPWMDNNVNIYNEPFRKYLKRIDPIYELEELKSLKGFLAQNKEAFEMILHMKEYIPDYLEDRAKQLTLRYNNTKTK